jgi:hypothetical protein
MLGVERKPPAFDILHDFSFCGRHRTDWPDRIARTATFRKFQYNGSAIKKQDGGSPDFSNEMRRGGGYPSNTRSTDIRKGK